MLEHNVAVLIGQFFAAGLHRAIQNFIHTLDVCVGADDGGKVLQRPLQRVIQAGHHQQEHKEGQNIQITLYQQSCASKGSGGNAQPQHKSCGNYEDSRSQFAFDESAFHRANFLFQPGKIVGFCVVGAQVWHGFHALLNTVLTGDLRRHRFAGEPFLHAGGQRDDSKRHRQRPDGSQRHTPVEKQQRHGDDRSGEDRTVQGGNEMGLALLQHGAVVHDGGGQIGKVFLTEEGKRDLPQLFRKVHTAHTGFHIGDEIGVVILQPGADHNEQRCRNAASHIKRNTLCCQCTVHDLAHQQVQEPHRQHEGDVLQRTA